MPGAIKTRIVGTLVVALVLVGGIAACGGGSGSSDATTSGGSSTTAGSSDSGLSSEFVGKGENGKLATLGKEAPAEEREAVSDLVEEFFKARETGDWAAQCAVLAESVITVIEKSAPVLNAPGKGCVNAVEAQAKAAPKAARANPMTGPLDVYRVERLQGFAFFHGTKGKDYVIPLEKERGEWKVASLTTQEVP